MLLLLRHTTIYGNAGDVDVITLTWFERSATYQEKGGRHGNDRSQE